MKKFWSLAIAMVVCFGLILGMGMNVAMAAPSAQMVAIDTGSIQKGLAAYQGNLPLTVTTDNQRSFNFLLTDLQFGQAAYAYDFTTIQGSNGANFMLSNQEAVGQDLKDTYQVEAIKGFSGTYALCKKAVDQDFAIMSAVWTSGTRHEEALLKKLICFPVADNTQATFTPLSRNEDLLLYNIYAYVCETPGAEMAQLSVALARIALYSHKAEAMISQAGLTTGGG